MKPDHRQLLHAAADLLQAFAEGTIEDGERRDVDETCAQLRAFATSRAKRRQPAAPKVILSIWRGIPTIYSDNPALNVEVVDHDTDDLNAHEAAAKRQRAIDAQVKGGKLHEVA